MRARAWLVSACAAYIVGCDGGGGPGGDGTAGDGGTAGGDGGAAALDDLESPTGCDGPFNPGQVLTYRITTGEDFPGREMDDYRAGTFACGDEEPLRVGVKPRTSGEGWMVDVNWAVAGQSFRGLRKLTFHTGFASDVTTEYLAWRMHRIGGNANSQRSALARVVVDGTDLGIHFNLEQIDKRFLRSRLGDDSGWLYKKSGTDDGYRTNETTPNPYEADFCFFEESQTCPPPPDVEAWLPDHLAIDQMLRFGGINMIIGNSDGPITKPHNFYAYDYAGGPRYYWPWDQDSSWGQNVDAFGGPGDSIYQDVLFLHWDDDYAAILTEILTGPLTVKAVHAEIDLAVSVGEGEVSASMAGGFQDWYVGRHADVSAQVAAH